jgi:aminomethyltransferase
MPDTQQLKATPLNSVHRSLGAKMVDFGGWDMPVQYSGIIEEHMAVRMAAGLFDVSHMGEVEVRGPEALQLVNYVATNNAAKLKDGQAHYSALLYPHGCFVDDILVHRVSETHYFLCVNASNQDKDYEHIRDHNKFDADVDYTSERYAQLAVQGPKALEIVQRLTAVQLASIRYYWFVDGEVNGIPARIARTGYTGEDGVEIYVAPDQAVKLWNTVLDAGRDLGIKPAGLGARNTLRLESKMALYGHEIDATINPLEADLEWIVKMDKGDFIGRGSLVKVKEQGIRRRLAGFEMRGRGIARDGYQVMVNGQAAGWVTSGSPAPFLNRNIGLCYLPLHAAVPGQAIEVMIRNQPVGAEVVPTPFYKRSK